MVERPLPGRAQKTTSRIALIGMTATAATMITLSIIDAIQLQEVSAAKPRFCYNNVTPGIFLQTAQCYSGKTARADCAEAQERDPSATTECYAARPA